MRRALVGLTLLCVACESSIPLADLARSLDLAGPDLVTAGPNVVPLVVDVGPLGAMAPTYNVAYATITLCVPGDATNCATIDHVSIDTGSSGLRVISTLLPFAVRSALPQTKDASGNVVGECEAFVDGYTWGTVRTADLTIGGETVAALPFMIIGDPALPTIPAQCQTNGTAEDTLATFRVNGILGIGTDPNDCGDTCVAPNAKTLAQRTYPYFSCATAATCTPAALDVASQVPNPVTRFATDDNGVVIELPDPGASGAASVTGSLVFGIGTQTNNALGTAQLLPLDTRGAFTTTFSGETLAASFIDSGLTDLLFTDSSLTQCADAAYMGRYCPVSTQSLDAKLGALDAPFQIGNAMTLLGSSNVAFDDLGSVGGGTKSFDWGLPFFYGRRVFTAIAGAVTPSGAGPYVAF